MSEPATGQQFHIEKLFVKDISFESPQAPSIFLENIESNMNLDVGVSHQLLAEQRYEVVLKLTITVTHADKTVFLVEVHQGGIFAVQGFDGEALAHLLGAYVPNVLFPYVRQTVSDLSQKGGFPPLVLDPINFDALYQQQQDSLSQTPAGEAIQ